MFYGSDGTRATKIEALSSWLETGFVNKASRIRRSLVVVTGTHGVGKTCVIRHVIDNHSKESHVIDLSSGNIDAINQSIIRVMGAVITNLADASMTLEYIEMLLKIVKIYRKYTSGKNVTRDFQDLSEKGAEISVRYDKREFDNLPRIVFIVNAVLLDVSKFGQPLFCLQHVGFAFIIESIEDVGFKKEGWMGVDRFTNLKESILVPPFNFDEASDYIIGRLEENTDHYPLYMDDEAKAEDTQIGRLAFIDIITSEVGCHPGLLKLIRTEMSNGYSPDGGDRETLAKLSIMQADNKIEKYVRELLLAVKRNKNVMNYFISLLRHPQSTQLQLDEDKAMVLRRFSLIYEDRKEDLDRGGDGSIEWKIPNAIRKHFPLYEDRKEDLDRGGDGSIEWKDPKAILKYFPLPESGDSPMDPQTLQIATTITVWLWPVFKSGLETFSNTVSEKLGTALAQKVGAMITSARSQDEQLATKIDNSPQVRRDDVAALIAKAAQADPRAVRRVRTQIQLTLKDVLKNQEFFTPDDVKNEIIPYTVDPQGGTPYYVERFGENITFSGLVDRFVNTVLADGALENLIERMRVRKPEHFQFYQDDQ